MSALLLVNSIAGNAILGSISTKIFDSLITSRFTQKNDKTKWVREKKLHLFSELSEELISMNCDNLIEKQKNITTVVSKIILLIEDNMLKTKLNNYTFILNEYKCYENEINIEVLNEELIQTLNSYLRKF